MRRILAILLTALFLFSGLTAFADVVYSPPETDFYQEHEGECKTVERNYYTNGTDGYISIRERPHGTIMQYVPNGEKVRIFCSYDEHGMVTYLNGKELEKPGWVLLSELYLIYDERSFTEEHGGEFFKSVNYLTAEQDAPLTLRIYDYPGAPDSWEYQLVNDTLTLTYEYADPEGRRWAKITYYKGIKNSWVCLSDPDAIIPPFGGDPNLPLIESVETPEPMPDESVSTDSPFIDPVDPPERLPVNPLLYLAIGLVILAVAGAVVLIMICYKRKEK